MPHKHTRRKGADDKNFDLAPTAIAKPLSAFEKTKPVKGSKPTKDAPSSKLKRKRTNKPVDDTPKAFARLMQMQAGVKMRSGLDNGESRKSKKRRTDEQAATAPSAPAQPSTSASTSEPLRILPGERMSDFAARVDQALPMGGLARKGKTNIEGLKERQTRTEKRLHKMYAEWREEDAKRKEKLEEFQEQQDELREEQEAALGGQSIAFEDESRRKKKKKRMLGETASDDDDPWAVLKERREKPKGLHDVVQAPPVLKAFPKEKFKVRNGARVDVANVPAAAGTLKRREELSDARREVIERYRSMMKGGRSASSL